MEEILKKNKMRFPLIRTALISQMPTIEAGMICIDVGLLKKINVFETAHESVSKTVD